jgi:hypothetical protein
LKVGRIAVLSKFALLIIAISGGCIHAVPHGTIAMKVSDNVGQASIQHVNPGEKVALLDNDCRSLSHETDGRVKCLKKEVGRGVVSQVINDHYAEIVFPKGTRISEGQMVEVVR